jgi:plasmid stabilization system protein ParE
MTFEIEHTDNALREIANTYLWIKQRGERTASRWREELIRKIESLAVQPEKHRLAPENPRFTKAIGQLQFRKRRSQFRVLYTIEGRRVVILSFRHHSRQPLSGDEF